MNHLLFSSPMLALVVAGVTIVSALTLLFQAPRRTVRGRRLPPGPVPLPFVGNVYSIDAKKPWVTYTEWAARYGDIFMIRVFNQDIAVINSEKIARELLDRRSNIYSDRPHLATREPYGWSFNFAFERYGNKWRSQRRLFHQTFRAEAALAFHPVLLRKARQLVLDFLNAPHDYYNQIQRYSAAVLMSVVYDYDVAPGYDPLVELVKRGNSLALEGLTPETASLVAAFPFLLNLPEWFPGAVIRRKAAISRDCVLQMIDEPFEHARKREAAGSSASAMALGLLKTIDDPSRLQSMKDVCATAFIGGADTTTSTLRCFMLAMLLYPKVQGRAQAEIDAVVGRHRLPDFNDRPNLPYIEAILLETLRMYSIAPLGVAHASSADDIYEDIFIPKGCTVVANVWCMHHNEVVYPEPDVFKPERFLIDGNMPKPTDSIAYGFGRRICPARYNADSSVWASMVLILYAFNIRKALDEKGEEIEFEPTFSYGLTSPPDPFPCSITPRLMAAGICKLLSAADV